MALSRFRMLRLATLGLSQDIALEHHACQLVKSVTRFLDDLIIENSFEEAMLKARSLDDRNLQSLLRSALPD